MLDFLRGCHGYVSVIRASANALPYIRNILMVYYRNFICKFFIPVTMIILVHTVLNPVCRMNFLPLLRQ
jgi:hypothetical protein